MGFSDKMRDSLGAEGARLEMGPPAESLAAGTTATVTVTVVGGSKPAQVDALLVRLLEAHRHWVDATGASITEEAARAHPEGTELVPTWTKTTLTETRIALGTTVEPAQRHDATVELPIPDDVRESSAACTHTLYVQADIKGQIDPTAQVRVTIRPA